MKDSKWFALVFRESTGFKHKVYRVYAHDIQNAVEIIEDLYNLDMSDLIKIYECVWRWSDYEK